MLLSNTIKLYFCVTNHVVSRSLSVIFTIRKMAIITTLQPVRTAQEVYKETLKDIKWQIYL